MASEKNEKSNGPIHEIRILDLDAVPVLEINGAVVSPKIPLTMELLEKWFRRV